MSKRRSQDMGSLLLAVYAVPTMRNGKLKDDSEEAGRDLWRLGMRIQRERRRVEREETEIRQRLAESRRKSAKFKLSQKKLVKIKERARAQRKAAKEQENGEQ